MPLNPNNYCIIMAGGFGSRFWPHCTVDKPKQFLDLLGTGESMLQATFRRFQLVCPKDNIIIVTTEAHAGIVRGQIPGLLDYQVLCEPFRRNTAPCIAYAASVIASINPNANIIVSPSDHAIFGEEAFARNITDAVAVVDRHDWIVTLGARPVNPDVKYGYIQFNDAAIHGISSKMHKAVTFVEKPPFEMAVQFISSGEFLWNAGIFVWRLPVLMDAYRRYMPALSESFFSLTADTPARKLKEVYTPSQSISVDYGIIEKADNVYVLEAEFGWSDVETWNSLFMALPKDDDGNAVASGHMVAYDSHNNIVMVNSEKYVVLQGLDNYIVASGSDTLMVCPRDQESQLMQFNSDVAMMKSQHKNKSL